MEVCAPLPNGAGFIQWVLAFIDCRAQLLGMGAYQALASPGSTLTLVITGFLTLFIAFFGYRLLLGRGPDLRTGVLAFVKIGIVLALATSWAAYRTLVYDVAVQGPAQLAAEIGAPAGLPGITGGLVARLEGADQAFTVLAVLGEGTPPPEQANQPSAVSGVPPQPYPGFNTYAIAASRMLFLIGAIVGLGGSRLVIGLLLAVGPFFIAFLLFENTRSFFEGWIRVLAGAALAALATSIALGVELALLEPWLSDILARRAAQEWMPGMPIELMVATTAFGLVILGLIYASAKIAFGFRLAPLWTAASARLSETLRSESRLALAAPGGREAPQGEHRTRAATVVDAVAAAQRREASQVTVVGAGGASGRSDGPGDRRASPAGSARDDVSQPLAPAPLGQSFRRTRGRVSASAGRRDRRS